MVPHPAPEINTHLPRFPPWRILRRWSAWCEEVAGAGRLCLHAALGGETPSGVFDKAPFHFWKALPSVLTGLQDVGCGGEVRTIDMRRAHRDRMPVHPRLPATRRASWNGICCAAG